ncbi:hypothetical protein L1887_32204 [Cichorium endivia]|nr:hypothetical protein L1887_32204 [Cichorium endivia]
MSFVDVVKGRRVKDVNSEGLSTKEEKTETREKQLWKRITLSGNEIVETTTHLRRKYIGEINCLSNLDGMINLCHYEELPEEDSDQGSRCSADESVVKETCLGETTNVGEKDQFGCMPCEFPKVYTPEKSGNPTENDMDTKHGKDPISSSAKHDPNNKEVEPHRGSVENKEIKDVFDGDSPLKGLNISGKLKILLSREIPISNKIEDGERKKSSEEAGDLKKFE